MHNITLPEDTNLPLRQLYVLCQFFLLCPQSFGGFINHEALSAWILCAESNPKWALALEIYGFHHSHRDGFIKAINGSAVHFRLFTSSQSKYTADWEIIIQFA